MKNLPDNLYNVESILRLEKIAINQFGIPSYHLMERAGDAVFQVLIEKYPQCKNVLILCGAGNNAGDGYVVARLAKQAGLDVSVISLIDTEALVNEALHAYEDWAELSANKSADISLLAESDIVVDALLGTGIKRDVSDDWGKWIDSINSSGLPVISVDIPSGLIADTGIIAGKAICADSTVSFIGLKQGMFTAQAKDVCGEIIFNNLALPAEVYSEVVSHTQLINAIDYSQLPPRAAFSHKGRFGHVLIVGGNEGMPGAVILAARAALRTGAGLVTILTTANNLEAVAGAVPEAMIKTCGKSDVLTGDYLNNITHIAIGMGLGQDDWALNMLQQCVTLNKPMLIDADALNLMALNEITVTSPLVITPHPGEAARLLSADKKLGSADIQNDRFLAVTKLHAMFEGCKTCSVVLKGSGTLMFDGQEIRVCSLGNAAMSTPGMGDVLSGIIIALMAQNVIASDAAELGVCLHAAAANLVTGDHTRGLLASDVIDALPKVLC